MPYTPATRYFDPMRCALIADALRILRPDTEAGCEARDQLERIMREYANEEGVTLSPPN